MGNLVLDAVEPSGRELSCRAVARLKAAADCRFAFAEPRGRIGETDRGSDVVTIDDRRCDLGIRAAWSDELDPRQVIGVASRDQRLAHRHDGVP